MSKNILTILGIVVIALGLVAFNSMFTVHQTQQALVLQFGEYKRTITQPGLHFKMPILQQVIFYEKRGLNVDPPVERIILAGQKPRLVDAFARWRIVDVVLFRQAVQTEVAAISRLRSILTARLREVLGSVTSKDIVSPERAILMIRIRDSARREAIDLGVEIIDVRIRRADLPEANLNATFARMNAEREREAADERARGKERAQEVRATADRGAVELVSEAERKAEIIRGEADAKRNAIYASAYGRDPEFFAFYRSMRAYERALQGHNTTLVISPDSEFFDYLKSDTLPAPE